MKQTNARLCCFVHNLDEIRDNIDGPLKNLSRHLEVYGPTGRLLLKDSASRAYVVSIRKDIRKAVEALHIEVLDLEDDEYRHIEKFYSSLSEQNLSRNIGLYWNVEAKLRDAKSIANVIRLREDARVTTNIFESIAIFVTRNPRLVNRATMFLVTEQKVVERSIPPVITDRNLAGILWIVQGGKGPNIPRQKLLANCTAAMIPRRDVITKMYSFLSSLDETKAAHFEALMLNDRCAHWLMDRTLGDAQILSNENYEEIYEDVRRATSEDIMREKEREVAELRAEYERVYATQVEQHEKEIAGTLKEHVELRQKISAQADEVGRLSKTVDESESDREARNIQLMQLCVQAGKKAERRRVIAIPSIFFIVVVALGLIDKYVIGKFEELNLFGVDLYFVVILATAVLSALYMVLQLWVSPDFLFRKYIERVREDAARAKAREFGVEDLYGHYEISWTSSKIERRAEQQTE